MKEIPISEFRAKCLVLIEQVRRTRKPLRLTRRGKPVAEIVPSTPAEPVMDRAKWLGSMKGSIEILGDIVSPASNASEWEALSNPMRVLNPKPAVSRKIDKESEAKSINKPTSRQINKTIGRSKKPKR